MTLTHSGPDDGPVVPVPDGARIPLSYEQEQLWFLDQLTPGRSTYNLHLPYRLRGDLRIDVLDRSLTWLLERHDALRARLGTEDGTPYQVIAPAGPVTVEVVDLSRISGQEERLTSELTAEQATAFTLEGHCLYRFRLFRMAEDDHVLSLSFHHVIFDGWSSGILLSELSECYRALLAGQTPRLPELTGDYPTHVRDQRRRLTGPALAEDLSYWAEKLSGLPVLELPTDRPRPMTTTGLGDQLIRPLPDDVVSGLERLTRQQGASVFTVFAATVASVLSRYTGQDDVPLGMPIPGRHDPDLESLVGLFINMAVLRVDLTDDPSFATLLERVMDTSMDVYDHQDVPFNLVVERVQPVRDPSRNPLFQVGIQVLDLGLTGAAFELSGLRVEALSLPAGYSRFDLAVNLLQTATGYDVSVEYATDLFDAWRIENLVEHLTTVLRGAIADPGRRLSQLPLTAAAERETLLALGRGEPAEHSPDPVHVDIARIAAATPDAVAAVCRGREMTYAELDRASDRLARRLRGRGTRHQEVVAILLDRDLDALVAILGVLKADAAFAFLDPGHPPSRLEFLLTDTAARTVITRTALRGALPRQNGWTPLILDGAPEPDKEENTEADARSIPGDSVAGPSSLAYVLYTSGSTGRPKGVLIEHRGLTLFTDAYRRTFDFTSADRLLQLPALTFDMSQGEIFTALRTGATLVLVAPEEGSSPDGIAALIADQEVTYAGLSPAILSVVEPGPYPALRAVMGGAEALPAEVVNRWNLPGRRFVNLYGPTEAAIACTEYECEQVEWRSSPPIGHPELNRQVYVVDRWGDLAPVGVPGELLIGGDQGGLARGYLNLPEATAEKFVQDPFGAAGTRVYRSGDLVRWTPQGELDFLGRLDNQVKLRGLRIELGEIEAALARHPDVRMALVLLTTDRYGEKQLTAYWTAGPDRTPDRAELTGHLAEQLPEYMIPTSWVGLEEFPLTTARKIDRKALPAPVDEEPARSTVPPSTPTEQAVAEIFGDVLALPEIGADTNFFDLGGNSLQAMRVVGRINKALAVKISIRMLYGSATVTEIAAGIDATRAARG